MKSNIISSRSKQYGVTSLFVVVFATLLLSIITLSFAQLMNREQQRSSDDELSQSAYDSAMAGVEDAKRVVMLANAGNTKARQAINLNQCDTIAQAEVAGQVGQPETMIQSTSSGDGRELNQAYTCVKINMNSPDYEAGLEEMKSALIPLSAARSFRSIQIEWHATGVDDLAASCQAAATPPSPTSVGLCPQNQWGMANTTPALLRAQVITPGNSFSQNSLDNKARTNTVFLYPKAAGASEFDMNAFNRYVDPTGTSGGTEHRPLQALCEAGETSKQFRCKATLDLISAVPASSETALLRLSAIYNPTSFKVTLLDNSGRPVDFKGIQPVVDSTGRANDLFRRVEARLSLVSEESYPEVAVDLEDSLCKDFYVTRSDSGRLPDGSACTP